MKKFLKSIALVGSAALAVLAASNTRAASTGFNQTGAGPYDYNTTANWVGSTINGIWDTSLTLTASQTNTFASDTVLATGLTFNYVGAFPLALQAAAPGAVNLTLGGDIGVSTTTNGNAANVTIGDATNHLNLNLGGLTRTITVASNVLVLNDVVANGGITKAGAGNLKLQGTNTYDGVTTINAGSVAIRTGNALGSTVGNTAIAANAGQLQLQNNIISPEPITVTGGNSTSPFLVPITSSSGSNTLTGSVTLNAGATSLTAFSAGASAWLNLNGAVTRDSVGAMNMNVANGSTISVNNTINNQGGNFTIKGPLASGQTGVVRWNISGHSFGTLQVRDAGTIQLGTNDAFATGSSLTVGVSGGGANTDVGTLDLGGYNQTLGTLNLTRGGNATQTIDAFRMVTNSGSSPSTLTVGSGGGSVFGVIVDGANANAKVTLTKTNNSGTLTLRSINTYTGPTIIAGGTLTLGQGTTNAAGANVFGSLSSGTSLSINSNATFDVSALATNTGTYTFTPASLTASGLGSSGQAKIVGSVGGTVDLTNKPITLVWSGPSSGTNNGLYAMNVVSSTLNLSSNQFTVVVPGAALTDGQYQLVFAPTLTGSVDPTPLYTGGNGVATNYTGRVLIAGGNVYLVVTLNTYNVTYATNNATSGTAPTDSNTYTNGQTVTVLANTGGLTRTGYTLTGWNTAADGSGTSYAVTGSATFIMGPANVKLWPVWTSATLSGNATLTSLAVAPGTLTPVFNSGTTNYAVTNANAVSAVTVTVTNADVTATNQLFLNDVSQGLLPSGTASVSLPLGVGSTNVIRVLVTAQDGLTTSNYFVTVTRLSTNASLANLVINAGAVTNVLNPGFAYNVFSYTTANAFTNYQVQVTASSQDQTAALQFSVNGGGYSALTSGVASSVQSLSQPPTPQSTLVVKSVSQDLSVTNLYTVDVTVQPSLVAFKLTNSVVGGTNLVLTWPADHTGYQLLTQTNNLQKGVSKNTNDWGSIGFTTTNAAVIPISKTNLNSYYRLVYP